MCKTNIHPDMLNKYPSKYTDQISKQILQTDIHPDTLIKYPPRYASEWDPREPGHTKVNV